MKIASSFLAVAFVLFSISLSHAAELADPASGCTLTVPDGWEIIPFKQEGGYSVASRSPDKKAGVSLFVTSTDAKTVDDASDYINGLQNYLKTQNLSVTKTEKRAVDGYAFYVITTVPTSAGQTGTMTTWITVANGKIYQIGLTESDVTEAASLNTALQSFSIRK